MSTLYHIYNNTPSNRLKTLIINLLKRRDGGAKSELLREIYSRDFGIKIGYGSYGGCFDYKNIPSGVSFGNYCSIADGVKIFRANHPLTFFTSHPLFYNPIMGYVNSDRLTRLPLSIGHDVWIGANAIILPTCHKIGNGAVIGAASIVTKDVPPYSIVAGNPAKQIKFRFNTNQIKYLENIKWWEKSMPELASLGYTIQNNLIELT